MVRWHYRLVSLSSTSRQEVARNDLMVEVLDFRDGPHGQR